MSSKHFYIHLDALLDTRAGTVMRLNPAAHAKLIGNNYHKRKGDFFEDIDPKEYRELYEKREVETLMESTMTNVLSFLGPQISDALKEAMGREVPLQDRPTIEVNVWPYDLTNEECAMMRTTIYTKLNGLIGVNIINLPIEKLTPGRCNERYIMMVMYDYHDYINAHATDLINTHRPQLLVIAPMVYFNTNPDTNEEVIDQLKQGINSLSILEAALAPSICVKFINVDVFSIIYPDDRIMEAVVETPVESLTIEELERALDKQREQAAS